MRLLKTFGMLLLLSGCTGFTPSKEGSTFWDQEVAFTAYGFSMVTPYGPFNFGYISWQRNIKKDIDISVEPIIKETDTSVKPIVKDNR